tara:strand:+ start:326 stop:859 length:534 start_codon:yes stop_codon:yes gene_type:complete
MKVYLILISIIIITGCSSSRPLNQFDITDADYSILSNGSFKNESGLYTQLFKKFNGENLTTSNFTAPVKAKLMVPSGIADICVQLNYIPTGIKEVYRKNFILQLDLKKGGNYSIQLERQSDSVMMVAYVADESNKAVSDNYEVDFSDKLPYIEHSFIDPITGFKGLLTAKKYAEQCE